MGRTQRIGSGTSDRFEALPSRTLEETGPPRAEPVTPHRRHGAGESLAKGASRSRGGALRSAGWRIGGRLQAPAEPELPYKPRLLADVLPRTVAGRT